MTKKDFQEMFRQADKRWETRFSKQRKELKNDIETAIAQVIEVVIKYTASKEDLKKVEEKLGKIEVEVKDVKRSINDLKADVPTPQEVIDHENRISKLENAVFPS